MRGRGDDGRDGAGGRRDLRILVGAVGLSTMGDHAALTALVLLVHEGTGSSPAVAALLVGLWGPVVLLGGAAGALVDRVENVRLLVLGSIGQAAVVLAMAVAVTPLAALLLAPLLGVGIAVVQPAEFALVPAAAGRVPVAAAGGHVESARYVGMAAGPLVGGGLAAAGLVRGALLIDLATSLVVAVAAGRLTARRRPGAAGARGRARARDGLVALAGDRVLATALAGAVASLLVVSATVVALVPFAAEVLGAGGAGYGALVAVWTAGMVAGAAGLARRVPARAHAAAALAAVVAQGLGILAGAAAAALWAVALAYLAGGAAQGLKNVLLRALIHERVAPAVHGRAYAAYNAARNGAELAALFTGAALVGLLGPRATLAAAGAGSAAIGLAALLALRPRALPLRLRPAPARPPA
ncbi:MFS transporter [Miltoncostaea marina]|uniref:MFS transporter n=1 Tax=Miltoncostaea marina TaxID=2843215 RepID=UPI001C3E2A32|nr:MFS transporter [Miltoncostaea marina]